MSADAIWMSAAASIATRGRPLSNPNPAVGAVVVREGIVIARGWTQPGGRPHAEAMALAAAGEAAQGASLYVTLEPCVHRSERGPACADLVTGAGLARVVVGCQDPDPRTAGQGIARIREAGIACDLIESDAARQSLAGYLTRSLKGRPYSTLKIACSLDGRIATGTGESQWITGELARAHGHAVRAQSDAILVGGETLRADSPRLNVRLSGLADRRPRRFVLTRGQAPAGWTALDSPEAVGALAPAQYLLIEGGAGAAAAFLAADRVDRLLIYRAPVVIGAGRAMIGDIGLASLEAAHGRWRLDHARTLGTDRLEVYSRT